MRTIGEAEVAELTEEQVKKYISSDGHACPNCGSTDLKEVWTDETWEGMDRSVKCQGCGKRYKETYILELEYVEEEEDDEV